MDSGHLVDVRVEHVLAVDDSRRGRAPIGPMKGTPDSVSAAEAATIADDVGIVFEVMLTAR